VEVNEESLGRAEHPGDAGLSLRDATVTRNPCSAVGGLMITMDVSIIWTAAS
jgi:hypothetical protein